MGKTDPNAPTHLQQSMIVVPAGVPGVTMVRTLPVFGFDHAPRGHAEVLLEDVRVPASNLLLGEGRGFEIAQIKVACARMTQRVVDTAIQAHGGGVTTDFGLAEAYAYARILRIVDGPDEVHNRSIGTMELRKYSNR